MDEATLAETDADDDDDMEEAEAEESKAPQQELQYLDCIKEVVSKYRDPATDDEDRLLLQDWMKANCCDIKAWILYIRQAGKNHKIPLAIVRALVQFFDVSEAENNNPWADQDYRSLEKFAMVTSFMQRKIPELLKVNGADAYRYLCYAVTEYTKLRDELLSDLSLYNLPLITATLGSGAESRPECCGAFRSASRPC